MELERLNCILRHFLLSSLETQDLSSLIDLSACGTYENQSKLPHLPVPKLEDSFELYLQSLLPLLNAKDHQIVKNLVDEALKPNSFIRELQRRLLEHKEIENAKNKSWLEDWWLQAAYLAYRAPNPTNSNFLFLFDKVLSIQDSNPQTKHAAMIINGTLGFKEFLIEKEAVKPQFLRGNTPLCMDQYDKIFTRTRVPHAEVDVLRVYEPTKHIVVISNSQFFELKVLGNDNKPFPVLLIQSELNRIEEISKNNRSSTIEIGALTAASRDDWTELRDKLFPLNKDTFDSIETALFVISLDHDSPTSEDQTAEYLMTSGPNSVGNRWFDKLSNFIVFENGRAGFNGEHAPLDAPAIGACVDFCLNAIINDQLPTNFTSEKITPFKELKWVVPNQLIERIRFHIEEAKIQQKKCDLRIVRFRNYGANFIKDTAKLSPDAFMQMAIQLAFYRIHRYSVATYETGATRQFFHGRTETVRTLSYHSQKFTQAMVNPNSTPDERRSLLKNAVDAHTKYMKRAVDGQGIDRHLLGLRLCLKPGEQKPEIFTHFSWPLSSSFRLSTSNLLQQQFMAGFGPTEADGYGVCYALKDDMIQCCICTFTPCSETSAETFKQSILQSFQEMASLFA